MAGVGEETSTALTSEQQHQQASPSQAVQQDEAEGSAVLAPEQVPISSSDNARQRPESVIVKLKAAANAPVLVEKKRKFKLPASNPLTRVAHHVQQLLKEKVQGGTQIFLYVSSAKSNFSPSPDQSVGNLYMCFGRESGKGSAILELTYTVTPSWG
mmetsp:Transcript_85440/g.118650  ORF Transcript_85440/g.118650 Transcript_85440/m.118650 type:complete len:156 (+) Transcript_85440:105-572(+)